MFFGNRLHTLHAEAVESSIALCGLRHPALKLYIPVEPVLDHDSKKPFLIGYCQMDQTVLVIRQLHYSVHRVIKRISEQRAYVHVVHKGEGGPVRHRCEPDTRLLKEEAFRSQDRIQYVISGLIETLELTYLIFHPVEVLLFFLPQLLCS